MAHKLRGISAKEAENVLKISSLDSLVSVFEKTSSIRSRTFGENISTCSIVNARCGICPEDCAFCAQSSVAKAKIERYPLIQEGVILDNAKSAERGGSSHYGIVCSGRAINDQKDLSRICRSVEKIRKLTKISPCASLGILDSNSLRMLKDAGLKRYHHNLESSRSFFAKICSSRDYNSQISTVKEAKSIGLEVCSGGIFGMGETKKQRIELLEQIRILDIDCVPLNFLNPIKGTPLENMNELTPLECLKIIAAARLMMPEKSIRICGGREKNLRDFQSWIFSAGADALMVGNYLVTSGRPLADDLQMIKDAGMKIKNII
ncbi:MAG TPA: biotin synthase BioB [Victivallales bacterium]|nr:biotin synthase BioB [Victivallales bacterium]